MQLVVHFDINETILVGDKAGGDSQTDCLHKMIAKSAFVRKNADLWWNHRPFDEFANLYTGWEWPDECQPYYSKYKEKSKRFVEMDGQIYRDLFKELERTAEHSFRGIVKAFFETLLHADASFVLRTMGTDLMDMADAVTEFANGKHPDYPNICRPDLELHTENLFKGKWGTTVNGAIVYQLFDCRGNLVAKDDDQVLQLIHSNKIMGIQDDYPFWKQHCQQPFAGKPVWKLSSIRHVLFDDNIKNLKDDSIACVRTKKKNMAGGNWETLSNDEIQQQHGIHLIRVPTVEVVRNPNWFLQQIHDLVNISDLIK